ncbi:MAG: methionyl-tRNA formyltransferase [Bryobacteraceae bacterium]
MGLKLVYLGTPSFAVPPLEALLAAGHEIAAVYTQPDRPKGRGREMAASPVKECALRHGLTVHQPERVRRPEVAEQLRAFQPDAMAIVGYGQIIPQSIIDIPRLGIVNVHASLLPLYRGAAPIQWSIANGETRTGVTTMRIDAGLDTGDILLQWDTAIGPRETAPELGARLAQAGATLLVQSLDGLDRGAIVPRPQDHACATLAPILKKEDGRVDWTWPAARIDARCRGFQPWPGAYAEFRGQVLQIFECRPAEGRGEPGVILPDRKRLLVACGDGAIELEQVQLQGRKRINGEAFRNGQRLLDNDRLS